MQRSQTQRSCPTTQELRKKIRDSAKENMRNGGLVVISSPTASGKTHLMATTEWRNEDSDVTGDRPVVMVHQTREARDQAAEMSKKAGVDAAVLKSREEWSAIARGRCGTLTIDGKSASEWLSEQCDKKKIPYKAALEYLNENNDQQRNVWKIEKKKGSGLNQWNGLPTNNGRPTKDIIHVTQPFICVPALRKNTNIIFDERPDFSLDLTTEQIRRTVTAYLKEVNAPYPTWEAFVQIARSEATQKKNALITFSAMT